MLINLNTPAAFARREIAAQFARFPLYRDEVLKNFDAMLTGLPTPLFDECAPVKADVLRTLKQFR